MSQEANQKLKLYFLSKILIEKTDDSHSLKISEIQSYLNSYGVSADRKTLYLDLDLLDKMGLEIIKEGSQNCRRYHVGKKMFEIAELKLLVDSVQSSKFITERKSKDLIKKLTSFCSKYEAAQLERQVVVQGRIKSMNKSIYYVVDCIHEAISINKQIQFEYLKWNEEKQLVKRREEPYRVSPWALTCNHENYYLVAYDEEDKKVKHFRVDKMGKITITKAPCSEKKKSQGFNAAIYTKENFEMFSGEERRVKIVLEKDLVGVFIDMFGRDVHISRYSDEELIAEVTVFVSPQFYGFLFGLRDKVRIIEPGEVKEEYLKQMNDIKCKYHK